MGYWNITKRTVTNISIAPKAIIRQIEVNKTVSVEHGYLTNVYKLSIYIVIFC